MHYLERNIRTRKLRVKRERENSETSVTELLILIQRVFLGKQILEGLHLHTLLVYKKMIIFQNESPKRSYFG